MIKLIRIAVGSFVGFFVMFLFIGSFAPKSTATTSASSIIQPSKPVWHYGQFSDKMTNEVTKYSYITSSNKVDMAFPYQGGTTADITIYSHGSANIELSKGQVMCSSYSGCWFDVKFDDGKIEQFCGYGSSNGNSKVLFLCAGENSKKFIKKVQHAQKVMVKIQVYQEGFPVFDFDVAEKQQTNG